ncbi:DUF2730 family protein [Paracoccus sp. (in: a-proteobacteria)]|uniref:DUF2730 family protein n=1 Tax=Paracoccus sp. TaxID=267 RepID=UPI0026E0DFFB|nr:DUF2730 family protein [Paracoccus sp. (in: a-proteobacteria)]MDO5648848.1 DUF2730 family protein [Paracoccus sp. (in: a-proteobacteria)]
MEFIFDMTISLGLIVTILTAIVGWVRLRNAAVDKRIDGCAERLDRHEARIHAAEQTVQALPGQKDMHELSLALSEMRGDMRELRAAMQGQAQMLGRVESVVSRQEEHLMRGKG